VNDEVLLSQLTDKDGTFRNAPRGWEADFSLLLGPMSVREAVAFVLADAEPLEEIVDRNDVRHVRAGTLRAHGFMVVHTPGRKVRSSPHVSVLWIEDEESAPGGDPVESPRGWTDDVSALIAECFNSSIQEMSETDDKS